MTPATGTALLILIAFVLPGFVAVLLKERLYEVRGEETTFDRLLTTVYYSLLVYLLPALSIGLLSAVNALDRDDVAQFVRGDSPLWLTGLVAVVVLLVLPALAALGAWSWMNSSLRQRVYESSDVSRSSIARRPPGISRLTTNKTLVPHFSVAISPPSRRAVSPPVRDRLAG